MPMKPIRNTIIAGILVNDTRKLDFRVEDLDDVGPIVTVDILNRLGSGTADKLRQAKRA
jgi:hypothetical protein